MKENQELPEILRNKPEGDLSVPNNYFRVMQNSVLERMALETKPTRAAPARKRRGRPWFLRPVAQIAFVFLLVIAASVWIVSTGPDYEALSDAEATEYILEQFELAEAEPEVLEFEDIDDELDYYLADDLLF